MNKDFRTEFVELYLAVSGIYKKPGTPDVNPVVYDIFYEAVKPYGYEAVKNAFSTHIKNPDTGQFMPKPADIVRIIDGTAADNSMQAWSKVVKAISAAGMYATVVFDDPVIHLVIRDMGGWIYLCQTDEDELKFRCHEFSNRYKAYKGSGRLPSYPKMLYGIAESENSAKGVEHYDKIKLIGDPSKAQAVLEKGSNIPSLLISDGDDAGLGQLMIEI